MFRRGTFERGRLERELLGYVDAAIVLQPRAEATMADCIDRSIAKGTSLARMVGAVLDGYAFLLASMEPLPGSPVVEEVRGLIRYHHLLVTTTATHFFNTVAAGPGVDDRFSGRLGEPAARLRRIRATLAAHVDGVAPAGWVPCADGAGRRCDEPAWRRLVGMIDTDSVRMGQILDNVLSLALLEVGDLEVRSDAVDVRDLIRVAVGRVGPVLGLEARLTVSVDPDVTPLAGCNLQADRRLAIQALGELVDNAARHAGTSAHVEVHARAAQEGVEIAVVDDGPGLSRVTWEQIALAGGRGPRQGIGIATAVGVVRAMGGAVSFLDVERGTHCLLLIPATFDPGAS